MESTAQTLEDRIAGTQTEDRALKREPSKIDFPYAHMTSAEELVGDSAESSQVAGLLDMSPNGGTFRSRVATARISGFVENSRSSIEITYLSRRLADGSGAPSARTGAFLNGPLFDTMFHKTNG